MEIQLNVHGGERIALSFSGVQTVGGTGDAPLYTGEYTVEPDFEVQTLETRGRRMSDNVSVLPIPYHEVSNPYHGATAIIGGIEYYGVQN